MQVHEHPTQHEAAEKLPLITKSAVVVEVDALDRERDDAVVRALRETLDGHGSVGWRRNAPEEKEDRRRWIRSLLDSYSSGSPLNHYIDEKAQEGEIGRKLDVLQARYHRCHPSLVRVVLETEEPVEFVAGQYVSVKYSGVSRVYSVASSPSRDEVELCIRRVPDGRLTPEILENLETGDEVTLRGPFGEFVMHEPSSRDLVFLATGTGVAPFKSTVDYVFEEGRDSYDGEERDVWLFLGAAWEDDLPYRDDLWELAGEHANFHFVPTCSREHYLTDWQGETAYVQHALVKYVDSDAVADVDLPREFRRQLDQPRMYETPAELDPSEMEVYACGINAMVYGLVDAVERLGVEPRHMELEGYG